MSIVKIASFGYKIFVVLSSTQSIYNATMQVAISSSCHDTVTPSLAVGHFLLQADSLEHAARLSL